MVTRQVHLVRHGEVHNPDGVLYGRLPSFGLSELGREMADAAARNLADRHRPVAKIIASPLQRTRESAAPIAAAFDLPVGTDERLLEPTNRFEGTVMREAIRNPKYWPLMINPYRPTWGEPYKAIAERMRAVIDDAFDTSEDADVVLVSHQLSIWVAHLWVARARFMHDPRQRRCELSSITTLERRDDRLVEVGYVEPAAGLMDNSSDVGAV